MNVSEEAFKRAGKIRLVLFDVDGVLTDGNIYLDDAGTEFKAFNTHDGHGIRLLLHYGFEVGVITGRTSRSLEHRMQDLKVKHVYQGCKDKFLAFQELLSRLELDEQQAAYVGDDIFDLQVMTRCGLAVAVANAHAYVKQHAHCETVNTGGRGAAREVCELVLDAQDLLGKVLAHNLR